MNIVIMKLKYCKRTHFHSVHIITYFVQNYDVSEKLNHNRTNIINCYVRKDLTSQNCSGHNTPLGRYTDSGPMGLD